MTGEAPKEWVKWLSLVELWYNSNFYTSTLTTPFEAVYGQAPPIHVPYIGGLSKVNVVDRTLASREQAIQLLKFHLAKAQNIMKQQSDKGISERVFEEGDMVFLKLQPHRQVSIRQGRQNKFLPKYFGPFKVIGKVGQVAYKLELPTYSQIHNVFHVSQLKLCRGQPQPSQVINLPSCDQEGVVEVQPMAILERKMVMKRNVVVVYGLIQWTNGTQDDATWENLEELYAKFPNFDSHS